MLDAFHFGMRGVFGTLDQLDGYRPDLLASIAGDDFKAKPRLVVGGENAWGRMIPAGGQSHFDAFTSVLNEAQIAHCRIVAPGPHEWSELWVRPILESLFSLPALFNDRRGES
jgi:hypothetical protein